MRRARDILLNRRMGASLVVGFYSGLPLYLLFQLVPMWLRREGVDLTVIGLFSLIQLPYAWKFVWAPMADHYPLGRWGRRKSQLLPAQMLLGLAIGALVLFNPHNQLYLVAGLSTVIAFYSATQDIVIDAYRRELLRDDELGVGTSMAITAYRLAGVVSFSLAVAVANRFGWPGAFVFVGGIMLTGMAVTPWLPEPEYEPEAPPTLWSAIVEPFRDFFFKKSLSSALLVLLFVFLYKLGDNLAVALATPFYVDMGFSNLEIATIAKFSALWASIAGGIVGGFLMLKLDINRALWSFGLVQILSILGYYKLSAVGADPTLIWGSGTGIGALTRGELWLFLVVSFEYIGVGLGTVAISAFILREANRSFGATQIALLTSLAALPRVLASASTGFLVENMGWSNFYLFCFVSALPGMFMLLKVAPWSRQRVAPDIAGPGAPRL